MMARRCITRERHYSDDVFFVVRGRQVLADESDDVYINIPPDAVADLGGGATRTTICNTGSPDYPKCFDCGGELVDAEAGRAPGSRDCADCGSRYADMRWHV